MSENNPVRDMVGAVTGVAKAIPVYDDVVQPAAKELGKGLQTLAKTVHVALAPVSALVWGYEQIKDFVSTKVQERLSNVPPENIVTPKPNVAGPVLEALKYTGHQEELSDLYANLLANSMDRATALNAHPAFTEIIKQLTPDEARLIRLFLVTRPFPLLEIRRVQVDGTGYTTLLNNFSFLGQEAGCEHLDLVPAYIDNLCRLGLAEAPNGWYYTAPGLYDNLEKSQIATQYKTAIESDPKVKCEFEKKGIRVTVLGRQFAEVCVRQKT